MLNLINLRLTLAGPAAPARLDSHLAHLRRWMAG